MLWQPKLRLPTFQQQSRDPSTGGGLRGCGQGTATEPVCTHTAKLPASYLGVCLLWSPPASRPPIYQGTEPCSVIRK